MSRLIELTQKAQNHNDIESLENVLNLFEPKIRASLKQTSPQEQLDLYQELKVKMIETVRKYDYNDTDGFWEFTNKLKVQQALENPEKRLTEKPDIKK